MVRKNWNKFAGIVALPLGIIIAYQFLPNTTEAPVSSPANQSNVRVREQRKPDIITRQRKPTIENNSPQSRERQLPEEVERSKERRPRPKKEEKKKQKPLPAA